MEWDDKRWDLSDILRELRIRTGLTQAELAEDAGLGQAVVARLEGGGRDARVSTWRRVFSALGYRLDLSVHETVEEVDDPALSPAYQRRMAAGEPRRGPKGRRYR